MRLSHLTLPVTDIARSKAFYLALGLGLIVDTAHYCRFHARLEQAVGEARGEAGADGGAGDETLSIQLRPEAQGGAAPAPGLEIGFEFDTPQHLDAFAASLAERGIAIAEGPVDRRWLWRDLRVIDPDGHELVFFHAGANKLDPPWRVRS